MTFSFIIPNKFINQTITFLNENDYQINENESDFSLGFFTIIINENEIPFIKDFIQEIQYY